jgi:O-antigen ligase
MFSVQQFSSVIAPLVEAVGRDVTFTGRTDIWEHISLATVNPLVGSGYWNFWGGKGGLAISEAMQTTVPNAHCGYLDIFLDGGMVGLFLLFSMLVVCANRLIRTPRTNRYQQVRFALVIVMVIYNLSESTFVRLSPTWVATLLVLIDFPFIRANGTMPEVSPTALSEDVGLAIGYSPQDISG